MTNQNSIKNFLKMAFLPQLVHEKYYAGLSDGGNSCWVVSPPQITFGRCSVFCFWM